MKQSSTIDESLCLRESPMLEVEFVQSSNFIHEPAEVQAQAGTVNPRYCLTEIQVAKRVGHRAAARTAAGATGRASRETRPAPAKAARVWLFALADTADGSAPEPSAITLLEAGFRTAPADEPVSSTLSRLMQDARQWTGEDPNSPHALVACALCFDRAVVAHNGGGCCFVIRHNHATRLTLGNVELIDYQVQPGDVLLLCGEPLPRVLKGSEMAEIAGHGADLKKAVRRVLDLAEARDPDARMLVVMIRVCAVERPSHARY